MIKKLNARYGKMVGVVPGKDLSEEYGEEELRCVVKASLAHLKVLKEVRPLRSGEIDLLRDNLIKPWRLYIDTDEFHIFQKFLPNELAEIHKLTKTIKSQMKQQYGEDSNIPEFEDVVKKSLEK